MSLVQNPFVPILSFQGSGLNNGSVYIGAVNEDPQTNPQAVFWDQALTISATQPLQVLGGYIMREGTPTQAYTANPYSILVLDRANVQVFYEPNATSALDMKMDVDGENADMTDDQKADFLAYTGAQSSALGMLKDGSNADMDGDQKEAFRKAIGLQTISLADYGVVGDCVRSNGGITSGANVLSGTNFTPSMIGKYVVVQGAGAAGASLVTTVSGYTSGTSITLTTPASTTVTSGIAFIGTDDSAAFTAALNACKALNNTGVKTNLFIPQAMYLVTFNPTISDPVIYNDVPDKSFYCFQGWNDIDTGDSPAAWLTLIGNGSTIVCDGPSNSWLLSGDASSFMRFHILDGLEFMASQRQPSQNGVFAYQMEFCVWQNVIVTEFSTGGIGLNPAFSERNSYYDLEGRNCTTAVRLGAPVAGDRDLYQANENRFYNYNVDHCGKTLTDDETLTRGHTEIFYSENPIFIGGSWKNNYNPLLVVSASAPLFDGIYFETPFDPIRSNGYALHAIFDARQAALYTNSSAAAIRNVAFRNCYFGEFSNILFRAGTVDAFSYHIETVTFDSATRWDDPAVVLFYVTGEEGFIHRLEVEGRDVVGIPQRPDTSSYPSAVASPPLQVPVTYPGGTLGSPSTAILDIQTTYPNYNGSMVNPLLLDRAVQITGQFSGAFAVFANNAAAITGGVPTGGVYAQTLGGPLYYVH